MTLTMRPFLADFKMRRGGVAAMDGAVQTGVDLAVPVVGLGFQEALAYREPGIVDQDVEAAKILDDVVHHGFHGGEIGHVGLVGLGLAPFRDDLVDQDFGILARTAVVDGDIGAFGGKAQRDFAPHAARSSGYDRDLASQAQVHVRSFTVCGAPALLRSGGTAAPALPEVR